MNVMERFIRKHLVRESVDVVNCFARLERAQGPAVSGARQIGVGGQRR